MLCPFNLPSRLDLIGRLSRLIPLGCHPALLLQRLRSFLSLLEKNKYFLVHETENMGIKEVMKGTDVVGGKE